jgi:hypothetical protein
MAEAYWTHCMYCGEMICGVEILPDYPDIVVLYAHKDCHAREERTCPDCNNPLKPPTAFNIGPQGHVCEGCRMYYDRDLNPLARIL